MTSNKLWLNTAVPATDLAAGAAHLPELIRAGGFEGPAKFQLGDAAKVGSLDKLLAAAEATEATTISAAWTNGTAIEAAFVTSERAPEFSIIMRLSVSEKFSFEQRSEQALAICRHLADKLEPLYAFVVRAGGSDFAICPHPPKAPTGWQLALTSEAEINDNYEDPAAFWTAGWTFDEQTRKGRLVGRHMQSADDLAYLQQVVPMQWNLARVAKPGKTEYFEPKISAAVEPIYTSGQSRLHPVGYVENQKLAEFSCYLGENEQIPGWQIYMLRRLKKSGKLDDGRPLETLRVVFARREMAVRERRPLLDVGVRVFYQVTAGVDEEITD